MADTPCSIAAEVFSWNRPAVSAAALLAGIAAYSCTVYGGYSLVVAGCLGVHVAMLLAPVLGWCAYPVPPPSRGTHDAVRRALAPAAAAAAASAKGFEEAMRWTDPVFSLGVGAMVVGAGMAAAQVSDAEVLLAAWVLAFVLPKGLPPLLAALPALRRGRGKAHQE
eukprot:TRINITY_DN5747_c0_g1_i1.p2 TRINITY_DN5747_c0_g1~~TRINITY_DN5747_c0_g1_i1.p2  ORF type:complete len:166 (+),score=27.97 TRINITY_DN5747_c0_g1_i1:192-689(+)